MFVKRFRMEPLLKHPDEHVLPTYILTYRLHNNTLGNGSTWGSLFQSLLTYDQDAGLGPLAPICASGPQSTTKPHHLILTRSHLSSSHISITRLGPVEISEWLTLVDFLRYIHSYIPIHSIRVRMTRMMHLQHSPLHAACLFSRVQGWLLIRAAAGHFCSCRLKATDGIHR